jgi:putative tricarboxylic transport membrane protein
MTTRNRIRHGVSVAFAALMLAAGFAPGASAADPKGVQFVVDTGAGGGSDLFARQIVKIALQNKLIPENWPVISQPQGGGLGAMTFMKLKTGQNNFVAAFTSKWVVTGLNTPDARASLKELTPIVQLAEEPQVVAVPASSPYKTFADFIADAKKNPGKLVQVGGAITSVDYLAALIIQKNTGTTWKYLSFEGGGPRITALLRGDAHVMLGAVTDFSEQVAANKLKVISVLGDKRIAAFPDAPTLKEQGVPDDGVPAQLQWRGVAGPPNMSPEAVAYFRNVLTEVTKTEDWKKYMATEGNTTDLVSGEELVTRIADFTNKIAPAIELLKKATQ